MEAKVRYISWSRRDDLPSLSTRNYFEADGELFHLVGRINDTLRMYRLDMATHVPEESDPGVPVHFALHQNYPNPFNPTTTIEYQLARAAHIRIDVINLLGQRVCSLVDEVQRADQHQVVWDGTNSAGQQVASGVYLYRITSEGYSDSKRMLLLR